MRIHLRTPLSDDDARTLAGGTRQAPGRLVRSAGRVGQLVGVAAAGFLVLPLATAYLAVVGVFCIVSLLCVVHFVGAALGFLIWLIDGGPRELWYTFKLLGIASCWFSLLVVCLYIHGAIIDRLKGAPRDADLND
ncbi:hypothetical protein G3576_21325 [Roseomonas stagni]|uniref:Transmembrane protein n=1 Tax=Falsiroseomonas algicola TaxID=2716930 RepID=A0A6M1LQ93_9PROT|nr:hypothetical protein [Falsiroseomonas algicola]NGM22571.1 hypothetical protein [Falsiroseomonas algicola]